MKKTNRFLAAMTASLLALTPMAATGIMTASAAAYDITVNETTNGYAYKAYPVFTGSVSPTDAEVLSNIEWATGFNSTDFLNALQNSTVLKTGDAPDFAGATTAKAVANKLIEIQSDVDKVAEFAKLAKANIGTVTPISNSTHNTDANYTIPVSASGYYLIEESKDTSSTANPTISRYMLLVTGPASISPKRPTPGLTKKIVEGSTKVTQNTANIGDTVTYELESTVPDMTGYDKYFFVFNDILDNNLEFDSASVKVYINDAELDNTSNQYFKVDTATDDTLVGDVQYSFQVVMKNFIQHKDNKGKPIKVTYSATLKDTANLTATGNPNEACLTYSNNPNVTATGESNENPDEPKQPDTPPGTPENPNDDYDSPVGVTPLQKVNTFTTAIKVAKVDKATQAKLTGAEFTLTSSNSMNVVLVSKDTFTLNNTSGTYWLLNDGTYTTQNPNDSNVDTSKYNDVNKKYTRTTEFERKDTKATTPDDVKGFVDNDGYIVFKGLAAGSYTLTESVTPGGYNTIDPINFTLSNGSNMSVSNPDWINTNSTPFTYNSTSSMYEATIENAKGSTLPSTGGMGTKLLYIFGSVFAIGSATFIVTRKRVNNSK